MSVVINKAGVVGAGFMGAEIAYCLATAFDGPMVVRDVSEEVLARALQNISRLVAKAVEKGRLREDKKESFMQRLKFTTEMEDLRGADFVIEAVFEDVKVKQEVFRQLEEVCSPSAVLATNTSGLSITEIASATKDPSRVIGTHFFSPASVMKLVEIVRGLQTSDNTLSIAREMCERMGKETIVVKDVPGFLTTRVASALWLEAMRCLEEGVASAEDIDKGIRLGFNHAMGPLETSDFVGLDLCEHVFAHLTESYGERFRPPVTLGRMARAGWLGRRSGRGFKDYTSGQGR
ncbi:MAG: 3-hydroxyacyl-CoA dehydrogenase family protein [Clostridia bacterium]|nr:MAG: 3-hydroxyacyl-CoA dehydrogenase family protein [Clostridia bacterium]